MCQAIVKPEGIHIPKHVLRNAWQANQDGAGFCYVNSEQDRVVIDKGFFKFKAFWKAYAQHQDKAMLIHFRWGTHGERSAANCHPFMLAPDAALIHNGVLSQFTSTPNSPVSDTRIFCDGYLVPGMHLSKLPSHDYLSSPALLGFIEALIGSSNKLAVMTTQGTVIFNEAQGEWYRGVWYSAGYPVEDCMTRYYNKYFNQTSGLHGEDTWLDDMLAGSKEKNAPLTGTLAWPASWHDEDNEMFDQGESTGEESDDSCLFCMQDTARMYKVEGQWVCGTCWHDYAG